MIVLNSSPLIHLTKLGKLNYLINKEKEILIPTAVFNEVVIEGKMNNYNESYIIENYINEGKIIVNKLTELKESFYPPLGKGEVEALELAKEKNIPLIIDDAKARNFAQLTKIDFQTTIATIFELLISKYIDYIEYKVNIKRLAENGWISADIIQEFLDKGEQYGR